MANANSPRGLVPYAHMTGGYYTGAANVYNIPATDSNNYFVGDPMIPTGSSDANGIPCVTLATAGSTNYTIGPIVGVTNAPNSPSANPALTQASPVYRVGAVNTYVLVADDPFLLFWIQESGTLSVNDSLTNANLVSGSGSTVTGYSGWQMNSSGAGTGATLQLRILRPLNEADNVPGSANGKWLVKINLHSLLNASGV